MTMTIARWQGGSRALVVSLSRADLEKVVKGGIEYHDLAK